MAAKGGKPPTDEELKAKFQAHIARVSAPRGTAPIKMGVTQKKLVSLSDGYQNFARGAPQLYQRINERLEDAGKSSLTTAEKEVVNAYIVDNLGNDQRLINVIDRLRAGEKPSVLADFIAATRQEAAGANAAAKGAAGGAR